jgi:hypothetical protein
VQQVSLAVRLLSGRPCAKRQVGVKRLTGKAICPICQKRRAERYCPAKGEKICAIDCGTEREVTIDCPGDCPYLLTAHRWEIEHPKSLLENEIAFPDAQVPTDLIHTRQAALSGIGYTVLVYAREQPALSDGDVIDATQAMAETRRTLLSGIYYEKPPTNSLAAGLYSALAKFIEDEKKRAAEQPEISAIKDSELFLLLVFFLRFGRLRSNGRPRTRGFIDFLRAQYPVEMGLKKEEPRIIVP